MIIHWKAVDQYFTVVLFGAQFYPVCKFSKFINFGLGTVNSERVKQVDLLKNRMSIYGHHGFDNDGFVPPPYKLLY